MISIQKIKFDETYSLRHQVMWPDQPLDYVKLSEDKNGIHFGLFKNEKLISVVSLFIKGKSAQFRKFATTHMEQGKGYGSLLLSHLIEYTTQKSITEIWCNARADKTDFYKKFGMEETTKTYIKENIPFVVMKKVF